MCNVTPLDEIKTKRRIQRPRLPPYGLHDAASAGKTSPVPNRNGATKNRIGYETYSFQLLYQTSRCHGGVYHVGLSKASLSPKLAEHPGLINCFVMPQLTFLQCKWRRGITSNDPIYRFDLFNASLHLPAMCLLLTWCQWVTWQCHIQLQPRCVPCANCDVEMPREHSASTCAHRASRPLPGINGCVTRGPITSYACCPVPLVALENVSK